MISFCSLMCGFAGAKYCLSLDTKITKIVLCLAWRPLSSCVERYQELSLAPTRRFFLASGLCLSLPNISCVGLRQVKQRNVLSHLAFLMRSAASLLLKHKHVYALLSSVLHRHRNISMLQRRFFKKKHSCGLVFSKLCYTPIFLIHIFSIK